MRPRRKADVCVHRSIERLGHEQSGPVSGDLRLARPLVERQDETDAGHIAEAKRPSAHHFEQRKQDSRNRLVKNVVRFDVAKLVAHEVIELLVGQRIHHARP